MRAHATQGDTHNRSDYAKGMQETRNGYTHSAGAGMACQLSTGTGMEVSLMPSWQRWAAQLTLSNRRWGLLWMVSTATCQTQRHEGRGDMSDGKGRETKKQKIKTNNRQKWHEPRHENSNHEANSRQNCSDGRCSFTKCSFKPFNINEIQVITHWPRLHWY